jgi:hypothetical protein
MKQATDHRRSRRETLLLSKFWLSWVENQVKDFRAANATTVLKKLPRAGHEALGASNPQTVQEHVDANDRKICREAKEEGLSDVETRLCRLRNAVHELDEVVKGHDTARSKYPKRRSTLLRWLRNLQLSSEWIPKVPGGVSHNWVQGYLDSRPLVVQFVRERTNPIVAWIIIWLYDDFHIGMSRGAIFNRDCHYIEPMEWAIRNKIPAKTFYLETQAAVASPRMRVFAAKQYSAAVERGEQVFDEVGITEPSAVS